MYSNKNISRKYSAILFLQMLSFSFLIVPVLQPISSLDLTEILLWDNFSRAYTDRQDPMLPLCIEDCVVMQCHKAAGPRNVI